MTKGVQRHHMAFLCAAAPVHGVILHHRSIRGDFWWGCSMIVVDCIFCTAILISVECFYNCAVARRGVKNNSASHATAARCEKVQDTNRHQAASFGYLADEKNT